MVTQVVKNTKALKSGYEQTVLPVELLKQARLSPNGEEPGDAYEQKKNRQYIGVEYHVHQKGIRKKETIVRIGKMVMDPVGPCGTAPSAIIKDKG